METLLNLLLFVSVFGEPTTSPWEDLTETPTTPAAGLVRQHEGCFSAPAPGAAPHRLPHSLSWQECVQFCDHRLNTHVGLQSDPSIESYNYCYCGDRLTGKLSRVNQSQCEVCEGVSEGETLLEEAHCGGTHTVSLYTLRETTPLTVLAVTADGLQLIDVDNSSMVPLITLDGIKDVAFHFNQDSIFLRTSNAIYSSYYSPYSMEYSEPSAIVENYYRGIQIQIYGLVVDWINDYVYYATDVNHGYGDTTYIRRANLHGITEGSVVSLRSTSTYCEMAIDPNEGWLFYSEGGKLHPYSLDVDTDMVYSTRLLNTTRVATIAVDTARSALYLAGQETGAWYLGRVDYSGGTKGVRGTMSGEVRVVYRGQELADIKALDVFQDQVVWVRTGQAQLFTCRLTPRCRKEDLKTVDVEREIVSLKIYHPGVQAADPCSEAGCSHSCSGGQCSCPSGKLLASDNRTCQAAPVQASYTGCLSIARAASRGLLAHQPLSWSQCVQLCDHRLATHAGMQADPSAASFVLCYCGELADSSAAVNDSLCLVCDQGRPDELCGDQTSLAVYKLRESTPMALILATDSGLKLLVSNQTSPSSLLDTSSPVTSVDYNYRGDEIYFVTDGVAFRTYFSPILTTFVLPSDLTAERNVTALAVDWEARHLYWEQYNDRYHNGERYHMYYTDLRGLTQKDIYHSSDVPHDLVIDPYKRLLFFIYKGVVHRYDVDVFKDETFDNRDLSLRSVVNITLDIVGERVFMIATEDDEQFYLASIDYTGQHKRVLYHGPQLRGPAGLAVRGGTVVWGAQGGRTLYQCRLTPRCLSADLAVVYQSVEKVNAFKWYHPDVQMPAPEQVCPKLGCSHLCGVDGSAPGGGGVTCSCPPLWTLEADGRTCTEVRTTTPERSTTGLQETTPTTGGTTTTMSDDRNTLEVESHAELFKVSTQGVVEPRMTPPTTGLAFMDVFIVVGVFSVVILLSVSICLQLRPRHAHGKFACSYRPASEMEELSTSQFNI